MNRTGQRGFTLVELLIALVLTGLIMSLLFASLRISSRAWDSTEQRQQAVAEQYQLQQLLRRLLGGAENQRVQVDDEGVQAAFRGAFDQVIFVASRYSSSSGSELLWYRLRLSEATEERPQALVLDTLVFNAQRRVDWALLFDPASGFDDEGEALPAPDEHVLRLTGDADLRFTYRYSDEDGISQTLDEWVEQDSLPRMVELSLEEHPRDSVLDDRAEVDGRIEAPAQDELLSSWDALVIAIQEYSYDVRNEGF